MVLFQKILCLTSIVNGYNINNYFFRVDLDRIKKLKDKMKSLTPKCIVCGSKKGLNIRCKGNLNGEQTNDKINVEARCNNWYHPICGYLAGFYNKVEIINDFDSTISENFCKYKFLTYCPTCSKDKLADNILLASQETSKTVDRVSNTVSLLY